MPSFGQILSEINRQAATGDKAAIDTVRKKYLSELSAVTKRDTIIYASAWTRSDIPGHVSINDEDIHAFMEAIFGLKNENLDLILHTGGGSAETVDAIVSYLRQKFKHIRVIVPQAAMSAGTMWACAADEIVMGKQSSLGPIDPQFILKTSVGVQALPAQAIIDQFNMAKADCSANPQNLNSWLPMLSQYGPALLVQCQNQIVFGRELVRTWLDSFMFGGEQSDFPKTISDFLSNHANFNTHSKHINIIDAQRLGLKVLPLEDDQDFQDRVLSAFHATVIAFSMSATVKMVANNIGGTYAKAVQVNSPK